MKKWLITALLILVAGGGLTFYLLQKPEVTNTATGAEVRSVFSDHTWRMNFTEEMREDTVNEETVYVEDQNGNQTAVTVELMNEGHTLSVAPPDGGYENGAFYTLHLSEEIKSSLGLKLKNGQAIEFKIVTDLPSFTDEQELRDHFAALMENSRAVGGDIMVEESASEGSMESADTASSDGAGGDFSTTNNQVDGVEEADIVQTDGDYIYILYQNEKVRIEQILEDGSTETVHTITLGQGNFYGSSLYLSGDTLIAVGDFWHSKPGQEVSTTTAKIYDVTDPASPALTREFSAEGYLASSRMVEDVLYLVTNHHPDVWIMQENEDAEVRLQPFIKDTAVSDEFFTQPVDQIQKIPESDSAEYATISAVPINEPDTEATVHSYLGSSGQIYMSKENLYIASMQHTFFPMMDIMPAGGGPGDETEIYKFSIDRLNVQFAAQGKVPGRILNQFSMDEHNGYFRAATTKGSMWSEDQPSVNNLYILDEQMAISGSVEDLAPGERIYSARFMGDKAYIVTFRETDPLYVIDTSDPTAPEVLGELKIPGFSTYLHPLDDNHLIGFGVETSLEETKPGEAPIVRQEGMKISLFDITDFNNPVEKDVEVIGGRGTHSPIQYDHKALFRHEERGLYGFPIMLYEGKDDMNLEFEGQGAHIYSITTDGIELAAEYMDEKDPNQLYEEYESMVQRMIYVDDHLYLVKYNGIDHHPLP
ncbi:beta-propeller domain-containing protein [Jeotgalibacillus haloalkalitolerans]|uniref:Beta-propeller domain-containing protein n=1 Tax=Jeotgalibacillus haloalkalitolerans TaxID=3104292 RepID=A0ABU5KI99_9BACL|nr:beta-propeller domain-containing protein [Jeotgalibacillus sp. HH7-29]MDZ5710967.1 beta-propeller domain-containing protein [Jeotgalibacillus sp. HH7-29]